jgi:signal transduction histidine kinase
MKLINHLTLRMTLVFTIVMLFWSAIYFILQMKEIHDDNDEGLANLKQEFIVKANVSRGFVETLEVHNPLNIIVCEIPYEEAATVVENFATTKVYFATEMEKEEVRMLTTAFRCEQNGKYYRLQFFTSTVESGDLVKNMFYLLLGLWIMLSITMFAVGKIVIAKANRPFYRLLDELKKFRLDSSRMIDFTQTGISEYARLNESVREALNENINAYTRQKMFIENVSHELQTPLAVAVAKLEMMIETYQHDGDCTKKIAGVLNILNRMKRINSNLLLLSKIKNRQFPATSSVSLRSVLEQVTGNFEELIEYRKITLERYGDASPVLQMNEDLAYIMFTNLIKNAVAHNLNGGKIVIRYASKSISIENSGNEAAIDVFERYQNASIDGKSSGLGLSIVRSIALLYGIDIVYRYDRIHVFQLRFS